MRRPFSEQLSEFRGVLGVALAVASHDLSTRQAILGAFLRVTRGTDGEPKKEFHG